MTTATATQISRLRSDIGANSTTLPDSEADDAFTEAGEKYTDAASVEAFARVITIRRLLASSAKLADYVQNNSEEKLSDVFDHLKVLLKYWEDELAKAIGEASLAGSGMVFFGRVRARRPWNTTCPT